MLGGRLSDLYTPPAVPDRLSSSPPPRSPVDWPSCRSSRSPPGLCRAGGAIVSVVALSLIMTIFTETAERAKAMGRLQLRAVRRRDRWSALGRRAHRSARLELDLLHFPVGITVFVLSFWRLLPDDRPEAGDRRLDAGGAVIVTAAVMLGTYAVINGNENG